MDRGSEVQSKADELLERLEKETAANMKEVTSKWKKELSEAQTTIQRLSREKTVLQTSIESLKVEFTKKKTDHKTEVETLSTELGQSKLQLTLLKKDVKHREEMCERLYTQTEKLKKHNSFITEDSKGMSDKKIRELDERLKQREHELQELKQSALMGAKLQDGNVNLAELSDTNRPTKIAERFGQLYDDYWTDAFQFQTCNFGRSDEEAIARLLEMLKMYFWYAMKARTFTEQEISFCTQYLELSVELCWYMIIQNPPVHIQFEPPMRGKPFKTGEYKFYSRSGKTFEYVVWPPLRLTEGGHLLAKGVAEPMR